MTRVDAYRLLRQIQERCATLDERETEHLGDLMDAVWFRLSEADHVVLDADCADEAEYRADFKVLGIENVRAR